MEKVIYKGKEYTSFGEAEKGYITLGREGIDVTFEAPKEDVKPIKKIAQNARIHSNLNRCNRSHNGNRWIPMAVVVHPLHVEK